MEKPSAYDIWEAAFRNGVRRVVYGSSIHAVCMRILSCVQVSNPRAVSTWLSCEDLIQLVERAIDTPVTGFTVVYGVSNNDRVPVVNARAAFLGYRPKDNAETHAARIFAEAGPLDPRDPGNSCHGGPFAAMPPGNSGLATMNIVDFMKKT